MAGKAIEKAELIKALEDSIDLYDRMVDDNLNKMVKLQEQISAMKESNESYFKKIQEMANKIRELKN